MRLQALSVLLLIATLSQPVFARNISNEQAEAAKARDAVGDAMSKLSELEQKIKSQEALLAQEQAKLQQYQADKAQTEKGPAKRGPFLHAGSSGRSRESR